MLRMIVMDICLLLLCATLSGCLIGWYDDDWGGRGDGGGRGGGHSGGGGGGGGHGGGHDENH